MTRICTGILGRMTFLLVQLCIAEFLLSVGVKKIVIRFAKSPAGM